MSRGAECDRYNRFARSLDLDAHEFAGDFTIASLSGKQLV
jgi:hypothetical protein